MAGLFVVVIFLAVGFAAFILLQTKEIHKSKSQTTVPLDVQNVAIDRAENYFVKESMKISALQQLLLNYLYRKFDLDSDIEAISTNLNPPTSELDALELRVHQRIVDPNSLVSELPLDGASPLRQMMMMATHCDHISLPDDFDRLIESNIRAGGYNLTHAAYSLERMEENKCSLSTNAEREFSDRAAKGMVEIIRDQKSSRDLRYEAVAFLLHTGRREVIEPDWIARILQEQQPDGGWKNTDQAIESDDHASLLAFWALLEYSRPNAPEEPVLRRPTQ